MATFIDPSSYRCDCGYQCDFFERTIRELGKISQRKTQYLVDDDHPIEFTAGQAVAVHCPTLGRCPIDLLTLSKLRRQSRLCSLPTPRRGVACARAPSPCLALR